MVYNTFVEFQLNLFVSYICIFAQFFIGTKILYGQFSLLYQTIYENEQLVKEMKKLLEIFPEGVLITKEHNFSNDQFWTNQHFEKSICDIKQNVEHLKMLKIDLNKATNYNIKNNSLEEPSNLYDLIQLQQSKLDKNEDSEIQNLVIECVNQNANKRRNGKSNGSKWTSKRFSIKTQRINWEGVKNAFMHVFIDMTDIVKLEEANNDVR